MASQECAENAEFAASDAVHVMVSFMDASSLLLDLSSDSRVRDVKEAIWRERAIPRTCQSLLKDAEILPDHLTLESLVCVPDDLHISCVRLLPGRLCVIGGSTAVHDGDAQPLATLAMFDPATQSWEDLPPMITARGGLAAAVVGENVYVIGGQDHHGQYLSSMEVFNLSIRAWSVASPMVNARSDFAVSVLDGKVFAVGGRDENGVLNRAEVFDPCVGVWAALPSLDNSRCRHAAAVAQGKLYAIGGYDGMFMLASVEVYDPEERCWSFVTSMHEPRSDVAAVGFDGKLYAIGGKKAAMGGGNYNVLTSAEVFDSNTGMWSKLAETMRRRRNSLAAVALKDGTICAIGGRADAHIWPCIEALDTSADNPSWLFLTEMPRACHSLAATVF